MTLTIRKAQSQSFAILKSFHRALIARKERISMASPAVAFARQNQQRFLSELKDLLRIPSVSTAPEHKSDVQRAAEFVQRTAPHRHGERRGHSDQRPPIDL